MMFDDTSYIYFLLCSICVKFINSQFVKLIKCTCVFQMFGKEAMKDVDYVECYPEGYRRGVQIAKECDAANIQGFPTWVINGQVWIINTSFYVSVEWIQWTLQISRAWLMEFLGYRLSWICCQFLVSWCCGNVLQSGSLLSTSIPSVCLNMSITRLQKASVVLHLLTGIITSFIVFLEICMSLLLWAVNFMPETVPSYK